MTMVHPLIGVHAAIAELGLAAFIWVFVEMFTIDKKSVRRMKIAALIGTISLTLSWFTGGYYYLVRYGPLVKPLIKAGAWPWAHSIIMEVKEHVFLFIPFLCVLTLTMIHQYNSKIITDKKLRKSIGLLCITIVVLGAMMAVMGYTISSAARMALGGGV